MSLGATVLALGSVLGSASVANAATFSFSFNNVTGPVGGTVSGTIELPDAALTIDNTYAATAVEVTSAPASLGWTLPLDVLNGVTTVFSNVFNVVAGNIVVANTDFGVVINSINGDNRIGLSTLDAGFGTGLDTNGAGSFNSGVRDTNDTTLEFEFIPKVPEPTSIISLIGVGVLGVASKKLKKKA